EPAWPLRRGSGRVDGDHLEEASRAEREQRIVRAHERVLAARHGRGAEFLLHPARALLERARRDDQVVEGALHRTTRQSSVMPSSAITFFTAGRAITRSTSFV